MSVTVPQPAKRESKMDRLCDALSRMAHELGPEAKLPTVLSLRDSLGVSVATLNDALTELETRCIVYRRHGVGIYVSPHLHRRSIYLICDPGFFLDSSQSPFWQILLQEIQKRANVSDETCSLHFALPYRPGGELLPHGLKNEILSGKVHGILAFGLLRPAAEWVMQSSVPLVAFAGPGNYEVHMNGSQAIASGVHALAERGCRHIALWSAAHYRPGDTPPVPAHEWNSGIFFRRELARNGLEYFPELMRNNWHLVQEPIPPAQSAQEQGYRTAMEVFGNADAMHPDGILLLDDTMTLGALIAMQKFGRIPERGIQIATHSNRGSTVLLGQDENLIRLEINPAEIVSVMFAMLETLLTGSQPPARPYFLDVRVLVPNTAHQP